MNVRVVCIDRTSFEICRNNSLWASKTRRIYNWVVGDVLIIRVDGMITGYARVASEIYESDLAYWEDALYPYRLNLDDWNLLNEEDWIEVGDEVKDLFKDSWGDHYGLKIINQVPLLEKQAKKLMNLITVKLNA